MINTKLQSIIDTKSAIGNAIVNKGGTITGATPFFNYAAQIDGISTGGGAYSTWVVEGDNSAKYQIHNGYDATSNPTPNLSNLPFNQWLLNNSASGDIVLSNAILTVGGVFNGPNTVSNQTNLPFLYNGENTNTAISISLLNNFVYTGGNLSSYLTKLNENNLAFVNFVATGIDISSVRANNGAIFVAGLTNFSIKKYSENLALLNTSSDVYGTGSLVMEINNGKLFNGGNGQRIVAHWESNLVRIGATFSLGGDIQSLFLNNGKIFVATGGGNVRAYWESNLGFIGATTVGGLNYFRVGVNNSYLYAIGDSGVMAKFHENNLAFIDSFNYNTGLGSVNTPTQIRFSNNYFYVGMQLGNGASVIRKYHESNNVLVANLIQTSTSFGTGFPLVRPGDYLINSSKIYTTMYSSVFNSTRVFATSNITTFDNRTYYTISRVKE
jgi:hypothetical protein